MVLLNIQIILINKDVDFKVKKIIWIFKDDKFILGDFQLKYLEVIMSLLEETSQGITINLLIELVLYTRTWEVYVQQVNNALESLPPLKASLVYGIFLHFSFSKGKKGSKYLLNRIVFYMMLFIHMATSNNSRSDLLNKNSHDYLLSHKTESIWHYKKCVWSTLRMWKSLIMLSGATLLSVWHDTAITHCISLCAMRSLICT